LIVAEATTCRRHLQAYHKSTYTKWATANNFISKLPNDVKRRKEEAAAQDRTTQLSLDPHTVSVGPTERVIPYSDSVFRDAAIQWLVETNQPIQALDHPCFKEMISIAARATNGMKIPNRKAARACIIELFKEHMHKLREQVSV
ncbi:hypothetical protein BJ165DRAFT_1318461, partial [Panaeolus papilionaceus]